MLSPGRQVKVFNKLVEYYTEWWILSTTDLHVLLKRDANYFPLGSEQKLDIDKAEIEIKREHGQVLGVIAGGMDSIQFVKWLFTQMFHTHRLWPTWLAYRLHKFFQSFINTVS